jgi:hypothetical protein
MNTNSLVQGIFFSGIIFVFLIIKLYNKYDFHNKSSLYQYLLTVNQNMYKIKLSNNSNIIFFNEFYNLYKKSLKYPSKEQLSLLKSKLDEANRLIKFSSLNKLYNIHWKFFISHNLENQMPFTIGHRIVIPSNLLNIISINTLIHEKIHVLQRKYQNQFNLLYTKMYPFLYKQYDDNIIPLSLKMINMNNPDGNNTYWIYNLKKKYWLPLLIYDKLTNTFVENAYEITYDNNKLIYVNTMKPILLRTLFNDMPTFISLYHPNEIFACELSHSITEKIPIHSKIIETVNNFN